ncbi:MAG: hypothetical protein LKG79_03730 [Furfurilactobacillus sp.]|jgi:hypothetical protein|uniref:Transposase n=1 Tax=Furfurilactobacillus milii TaxID=2888272 RepID=A0ABT6D909_9LACO|nr:MULTISPECIES: hypothetical protein [Furfurilactobacillus]QLE67218.1 hypothetical protein LROSL2_1868 [Furfurilactobacillus rossiae]MCF6161086.1 hypothetical protein [Furfurilactobacillus milii]MCF6163424.1 hypothetical protein [Furfurilactobacillus milii]MCF6418774.1 hypothetical protein [Furfurilactobacillus milii]MCH4011413.1 hypothetical protein [Furfurilactobacillus sp.]
MEKHEIVQIELPQNHQTSVSTTPIKAMQLRLGQNKTVIIYNKANSYLVDALLKAVFNDAH